MDIKKKAKFRIVIKDIDSKKTKIITIYQSRNKIEFFDFVEGLKKKIQEW